MLCTLFYLLAIRLLSCNKRKKLHSNYWEESVRPWLWVVGEKLLVQLCKNTYYSGDEFLKKLHRCVLGCENHVLIQVSFKM